MKNILIRSMLLLIFIGACTDRDKTKSEDNSNIKSDAQLAEKIEWEKSDSLIYTDIDIKKLVQLSVFSNNIEFAFYNDTAMYITLNNGSQKDIKNFMQDIIELKFQLNKKNFSGFDSVNYYGQKLVRIKDGESYFFYRLNNLVYSEIRNPKYVLKYNLKVGTLKEDLFSIIFNQPETSNKFKNIELISVGSILDDCKIEFHFQNQEINEITFVINDLSDYLK